MPFLAPPANLAEQEVCAYIIDGIAGGSSQLDYYCVTKLPQNQSVANQQTAPTKLHSNPKIQALAYSVRHGSDCT
jgi:hypothetical protein